MSLHSLFLSIVRNSVANYDVIVSWLKMPDFVSHSYKKKKLLSMYDQFLGFIALFDLEHIVNPRLVVVNVRFNF
jgi:hypothetical protein